MVELVYAKKHITLIIKKKSFFVGFQSFFIHLASVMSPIVLYGYNGDYVTC